MNENEILGFDPTQLSVYNQEENTPKQFNSNLYKTKPAESKSDDGIYRATIKVIYNPFNLRQSVLEQQSYGLQDADGWFTVVSSLTVNDTSCPIFKAWKKCHFAEKGSDLWKQAASVEDGGKALFDKRFGRYVTIQVLEDKNHPELEGKYMLWKMPKSVWDVINAKMNTFVICKIAIISQLYVRNAIIKNNIYLFCNFIKSRIIIDCRIRDIIFRILLSEFYKCKTFSFSFPCFSDMLKNIIPTAFFKPETDYF